MPLKAAMYWLSTFREMPEQPLARTLILRASNILVLSGVKGDPTPAEWDLIRFSCNSLKIKYRKEI